VSSSPLLWYRCPQWQLFKNNFNFKQVLISVFYPNINQCFTAGNMFVVRNCFPATPAKDPLHIYSLCIIERSANDLLRPRVLTWVFQCPGVERISSSDTNSTKRIRVGSWSSNGCSGATLCSLLFLFYWLLGRKTRQKRTVVVLCVDPNDSGFECDHEGDEWDLS
jgi:hypothetical protein